MRFCDQGIIYLSVVDESGNIFTDIIIAKIGEIFSLFTSCYIAEKYGRLYILKYSGLIGGIAFFLIEFIENRGLKAIFIFIISLCFSAGCNVIVIYSPEVIPTSVRSTVMGYLFLAMRFGSLTCPILSVITAHAPILFSVFALVSSYLGSQLTETLGKEINDIIPELAVKRRQSFLSTSEAAVRRKTITHITRMSLIKELLSDELFKIEK